LEKSGKIEKNFGKIWKNLEKSEIFLEKSGKNKKYLTFFFKKLK